MSNVIGNTPLSAATSQANLYGMAMIAIFVGVIAAIFSILGSNASGGRKFMWVIFMIIPIVNLLGLVMWFGSARNKYYKDEK